jgi:hypothetical protein
MDGAVANVHARHAAVCPGHMGLDLEDPDTKEQLDHLDPKLEIKRYFSFMMWLGVYLFGV